MAGNQSRGLIQASITRGWDPRVIVGRDGADESTILPNFDKDNQNIRFVGDGLGKLPDGTPDGWPDGHDVIGVPSPSPQAVDFQSSQNDGQTPNRATKGADPYKGFGEGGY